jgi:hypothetical protein
VLFSWSCRNSMPQLPPPTRQCWTGVMLQELRTMKERRWRTAARVRHARRNRRHHCSCNASGQHTGTPPSHPAARLQGRRRAQRVGRTQPTPGGKQALQCPRAHTQKYDPARNGASAHTLPYQEPWLLATLPHYQPYRSLSHAFPGAVKHGSCCWRKYHPRLQH